MAVVSVRFLAKVGSPTVMGLAPIRPSTLTTAAAVPTFAHKVKYVLLGHVVGLVPAAPHFAVTASVTIPVLTTPTAEPVEMRVRPVSSVMGREPVRCRARVD